MKLGMGLLCWKVSIIFMMIKLGLKKSSDREEKRHERIIDKNLQRLNIQKLNLSNLVSWGKLYLNKIESPLKESKTSSIIYQKHRVWKYCGERRKIRSKSGHQCRTMYNTSRDNIITTELCTVGTQTEAGFKISIPMNSLKNRNFSSKVARRADPMSSKYGYHIKYPYSKHSDMYKSNDIKSWSLHA